MTSRANVALKLTGYGHALCYYPALISTRIMIDALMAPQLSWGVSPQQNLPDAITRRLGIHLAILHPPA